MKTLLIILAVMALAGTAVAQTNIFFSEYIEGSGNNKAVEIYNNTNQSIDLARVLVERYNNGSTTLGFGVNLAGTLAAGDVFVIANASAEQAILDVADDVVNSEFTYYNGDDVLMLYLDGVLEDSIGRLGEDPGSYWGTDPITTQNMTLIRDPNNCAGDTDTSDAYDPAGAFIAQAIDTFTDLGTHTNNCAVVADEPTTWSMVKGLYR